MVRSKAKTTSKGQLTLPVAIRKALNVGAGDVVAFDIGPTASCSGMISRPIGSQSSLANSALAVASPQKRSGGGYASFVAVEETCERRTRYQRNRRGC
jgi:hypothetical protein